MTVSGLARMSSGNNHPFIWLPQLAISHLNETRSHLPRQKISSYKLSQADWPVSRVPKTPKEVLFLYVSCKEDTGKDVVRELENIRDVVEDCTCLNVLNLGLYDF